MSSLKKMCHVYVALVPKLFNEIITSNDNETITANEKVKWIFNRY